MQFGAIATDVAIPVTMDKICPIMVFLLVKFLNAGSIGLANTRRQPRKCGRIHPFE